MPKILRYAEYLQQTGNLADGQIALTKLMGYEDDEVERREREIKDIINRIIEKNDLAEIQKFADYRNYMSYEIIINNEEVKDGKLSKQVGYNSGAGTQIPIYADFVGGTLHALQCASQFRKTDLY